MQFTQLIAFFTLVCLSAAAVIPQDAYIAAALEAGPQRAEILDDNIIMD
jgi:hypothetical protein